MFDLIKEELRIREVYSRRGRSRKPSLYTWHNEDVLLRRYRFGSTVKTFLKKYGFLDLSDLEILDIGCGNGYWLRQLMEWGASPIKLHGIDLLQDRIEHAKTLAPQVDYRIASGYSVPFGRCELDLVFAHTLFSSILNRQARKALASEMIRVLKPHGRIFIYDFRISHPRNPDTVGIRKAEIKRLFAGFNIELRSLTLAPPIGRKVASKAPVVAHFIEAAFPFLRSHAVFFLYR